MFRRAFFLGTALLAGRPAMAAGEVTFIYVGGWDCPYCTAWKNDSKAKFLASPLARRVRFVEIESPNLKHAYEQRYWPEEFRPVLALVPKKSGTPRFLVVKDGKIVANEFGIYRWPHTIEAMEKAVG